MGGSPILALEIRGFIACALTWQCTKPLIAWDDDRKIIVDERQQICTQCSCGFTLVCAVLYCILFISYVTILACFVLLLLCCQALIISCRPLTASINSGIITPFRILQVCVGNCMVAPLSTKLSWIIFVQSTSFGTAVMLNVYYGK